MTGPKARERNSERLSRQLIEMIIKGHLSEFHLLIARMSGNAILPLLMEALSCYVTAAQKKACEGDLARNRRALEAHECILEKITHADPEAAAIEMAHHHQLSAESLG